MFSRVADAHGELAWVATGARMRTTRQKQLDLVTTETMVLRKMTDGWRIVHIHWSNRRVGPK